MASGTETLSGILPLDKPAGLTSAAAVARVKKIGGRVKVGHLGTLDPMATGLLPLCLGEGTKAAPYLSIADKAYEGVILLGVITDTLDVTGTVAERRKVPDLASIDLESLAARFTGNIEQVPPAFSAIKKGGVPMYRLARKGEAPAMDPRRVRITFLELSVAGPERLSVRLRCSKGTYVRSLARDIGEALGCGGTLEALRRTGFGRLDLASAVTLAELEEGGRERLRRALIPLSEALSDLRPVRVDDETAGRLRRGQQQALASAPPPRRAGETGRVLGPAGELVAVVREQEGRWRLDRVFAESAPCGP